MTEHDILDNHINLTDFGRNIPIKMLLTNNNPYIIVLVLAVRKNNDVKKGTTGKMIFESYFDNTCANYEYLEHVLEKAQQQDLIYMETEISS